jgi:hypothetical protein
VVIRDDQGKVLISAWGTIENATCAEQVEIIACSEAVKLAAKWVMKSAVLESDCPTAVNLLLTPELQRSPWAFIMRETVSMAAELPSFAVKHVKREQNNVAHELGQMARRLSHSAVWHNQAPVCVEHSIAQDCTPTSE